MATKKTYSPRFETVKSYYEKGLWSKQMVQNAVGKWITEAEFAEIVGED